MEISKETRNKTIISLLLILLGVFSVTKLGSIFTNPDLYKGIIETLDSKKNFVFEVAGSSTIASVLVGLIPGDSTTPLASQFMNLSSYLLIILSILLFEKYILTIIGFVVFDIVVPILCLAIIVYIYLPKDDLKIILRNAMLRISSFFLVLLLIIPTSVGISSMIDDTYETGIKNTVAEIQRDNDNNYFDTIASFTSNLKNKVTNWLNNTIEYIAVMIVTSCLIPLGTFFALIWLANQILKINIKTPNINNAAKVLSEKAINTTESVKGIINKNKNQLLLQEEKDHGEE